MGPWLPDPRCTVGPCAPVAPGGPAMPDRASGRGTSANRATDISVPIYRYRYIPTDISQYRELRPERGDCLTVRRADASQVAEIIFRRIIRPGNNK